MVAGDRRRGRTRRRRRCGASGVMRVATKYPQDRGRLLRAHRSAGRDRRGQGLGRARAAHRPGRGDRRPHRDRHDAARERPRGPRGDLRLDGAADRQPGRAQAQGGGDRRARRPAARRRRRRALRVERLSDRGRPRGALPRGRARWRPAAPRRRRGVRARRGGARRRRRRAARARRAATTAATAAPVRLTADELDEPLAAPDVEARPGHGDRQRDVRRRAQRSARTRRCRCRRGSASCCARCRSARAGVYVPGGRAPLAVDGRHGRRHGPRRRRRGGRAWPRRRRCTR